MATLFLIASPSLKLEVFLRRKEDQKEEGVTLYCSRLRISRTNAKPSLHHVRGIVCRTHSCGHLCQTSVWSPSSLYPMPWHEIHLLDTDSCLSSLLLLSDDWNSVDDNCANIWFWTERRTSGEKEERILIARQKTKETRGGEEMRTFSKVETALSSLECLRVIWPINSFPVTRIECEGRTRIENKCAS